MKNRITLVFLFWTTFFFAQNNSEENEMIFENLKLEMTLNSYNDIKEINLTEIKSIFKQSKTNQPIEFQAHCKNIKNKKINAITDLSFKVNGNSNDLKSFMTKIKAIKKSIKKYYNNQKSNK